MIISLWMFLCGYVRFVVSVDSYENVVVELFRLGAVPLRQKKKKKYAYFDFNLTDAYKVREMLSCVCDYSVRECGALHLIKKYRHRMGLFIGVIIILLALYVSKLFIWNINIEGLKNVSEQRALDILHNKGIYIGAYIPSLELHEIYNDILIEYDEFCWISVNIRGTVANVEFREAEYPSDKINIVGKYANIVSKYDSEIVAVKTYKGADVVKIGDVVRAGELLVSGLYEDKMGRLNYCYSQGEVIGRVECDFMVEVPLEYKQKVYTGDITHDFSIKFFSKSINILNSSRKNDIDYDIIEKNEQITLFDSIILPLSYSEKIYKNYVLVERSRDEAMAKKIAYEKIGKDILSFVGEGEIVSKEYSSCVEDGRYKLSAVLVANVNVAQVQEFKLNEG